MRAIFLVRHGETTWNRQKRVMGRREIPLNRVGIAQARRIARLIPEIGVKAIYASPLTRAMETARILANSAGLPVKTDIGLTEVAFGRWEGHLFRDLRRDKAYQRFVATPLESAVPGGETIVDVQNRGLKAINKALKELPQARILFVSHGDVIRAVLCHFLGLPLEEYRQLRVDTGSLSGLETDGDWAEVKFLNYLPDVAGLSRQPFDGLNPSRLKSRLRGRRDGHTR
ncbi:MAG: histidine phosphatase family protein [Candidatus Binatia bacterium]|jgi:broad specificity phosphatase PhoE